jgi:hypothetical protein
MLGYSHFAHVAFFPLTAHTLCYRILHVAKADLQYDIPMGLADSFGQFTAGPKIIEPLPSEEAAFVLRSHRHPVPFPTTDYGG